MPRSWASPRSRFVVTSADHLVGSGQIRSRRQLRVRVLGRARGGRKAGPRRVPHCRPFARGGARKMRRIRGLARRGSGGQDRRDALCGRPRTTVTPRSVGVRQQPTSCSGRWRIWTARSGPVSRSVPGQTVRVTESHRSSGRPPIVVASGRRPGCRGARRRMARVRSRHDPAGAEGWVPSRFLERTADGRVHPEQELRHFGARGGPRCHCSTVEEPDLGSGWLWCQDATGGQGWVPARCVEPDEI